MSAPKVLLFDIETAPILANVWQCWKQNINLNQIKEDWYILSFAAKWLGDDEVFYMDCREELFDDKLLCSVLWSFLDRADWVITHNGDKFDIPKIKARMLLNGLKPFSPVQSIDTCKQAKRVFGFTSNKLEYLSSMLCPEVKKLKHSKFAGFELWKECLAGNTEAWDEMEAYNKQDVLALEGVYKAIMPWMTTHPNFGLHIESTLPVCPKCGGHVKKRGFRYTNVGKYQRYQCLDCGAASSERTMDKADRSHVLRVY